MTKYYYLVASLPALTIGDPSPFSPADLRSRCATLMSEDDLAELDRVLEGRAAEGRSGFCRRWLAADAQLRNAVARVRAGRLGIEVRPHLKEHAGFSVLIEKAVTDAYARPDPLGRASALDRCRWQLLDEIAFEDAFGLTAILAFAVKLQIVMRWAELKDEQGRQKVEEFVAGSLEGKMSAIGV